jgi:chromosome segregation ATPase
VTAPAPTAALRGRQADSARRRDRVLKAISTAIADRQEISASGIARAAGVDRTFLYRHRDLIEQIHAAQAQVPSAPAAAGPAVSHASLQADLLNAQQRATRLAVHVHQLERRLSGLLGEHAWQESGLGTPADIDTIKQQNLALEQQITDLRLQLQERDQDLTAARAANRELMAQLNASARRR